MAHIAGQDIAQVLDHFADVIEGGNAYTSGTSFNGLPGRHSNDPSLADGTDTPITADSNGDTTTVPYSSGDWPSDRWEKTNIPGYFLLCTSATNTENENAARRITGWDNTAKEFTVDAFPAAVQNNDVFTVLQGFKRFPDQRDYQEDEDSGGFDRFFDLSIDNIGEQVDRFGKGVRSRDMFVTLRLRILHYTKMRTAWASMFANMAILQEGLLRTDNWDNDFIRAVLAEGETSQEQQDERKIIARQQFRVRYRIDTTFN